MGALLSQHLYHKTMAVIAYQYIFIGKKHHGLAT